MIAAGCLATAISAGASVPAETNAGLAYPPGMTDRMVHLGPADFAAGEAEAVEVRADRLVLTDGRAVFPRRGRWDSAPMPTEFPFTELIPSWNVSTPPSTGMAFFVRVRSTATAEWSPWLYIGHWGRIQFWPSRTLEFPGGRVNVDILALNAPADAWQISARFYDFQTTGTAVPALLAVSAVYSGVVAGDVQSADRLPAEITPWTGELAVPFHAQNRNGEAIRASTCSPTCTAMVMGYWGVETDPVAASLAIHDPEYGIFGNWARAVAYASNAGDLRGWVGRVRDRESVRRYLAAGVPLIASIRFANGEFPGNPMPSTNGHLVVIRGLTPAGDLVVNDPAHEDSGDGIVYSWEAFRRAWIDKGGIAYVLAPAATLAPFIGEGR